MNIQPVSRIARAIGIIALAFDTTIRVFGKYARRSIDAISDKPLYNISVSVRESETDVEHRVYENVPQSRLSSIMAVLDILPNSSITIWRSK
jgi:hypothetical protein